MKQFSFNKMNWYVSNKGGSKKWEIRGKNF